MTIADPTQESRHDAVPSPRLPDSPSAQRPPNARVRPISPVTGRSTLMTRAPRSASWRVQNGAAMACSRVTTVTP